MTVALLLGVAGLRRLRPRIRPAVTVPRWVNAPTAAGLGLLMTGVDLPNAFPYFIAIERIVGAGLGTAHALLIIAGYALVYCLPCLLLLIAGAFHGERVRAASAPSTNASAPRRSSRAAYPSRWATSPWPPAS